jgi:hypothetical protein
LFGNPWNVTIKSDKIKFACLSDDRVISKDYRNWQLLQLFLFPSLIWWCTNCWADSTQLRRQMKNFNLKVQKRISQQTNKIDFVKKNPYSEWFNPFFMLWKRKWRKNEFQVRSCLIVSAAEIVQELSWAREKNKIKKTRFFLGVAHQYRNTLLLLHGRLQETIQERQRFSLLAECVLPNVVFVVVGYDEGV